MHFIDFSLNNDMDEKEKERENERKRGRMGRSRKRPKKLKEKVEEAACSETAIKFSETQFAPNFFTKYASVTSCDVEESTVCSTVCSQINT